MKHLVTKPHIILNVDNPAFPDAAQVSLKHKEAIALMKVHGESNRDNVHSIDGHYGSPEKSILISEPTEEQTECARALAHMSGQESHIESDGKNHKMLFSNGPQKGKIVEGSGTQFHTEKPSDYYSVLPDGSTFSHNFNFEKSENLIKKDKSDKYGLSTNQNRKIQFQNTKGINKPYAMGSGEVGVSSQGYTVRGAMATISPEGNRGQAFRQPQGGPNYNRQLARDKAKKVLSEMKQMPKPKLTKKETSSTNPTSQVKINPEHGKIIANAYDQMKHDPNHPEVKAAYGALISETKNQFKDMIKQGFKFSQIKEGQDNPYKTSKDLHSDIEQNKHIHYFPTSSGFGSGDQSSDHPMLQPTEFVHNGKPLLANDVFRIVHDFRGHHLGGKSTFSAKGEHQAYLTHKKDFSPLAQKALATETLGQNSWVNFGPHGENNRKNPQNTIYADQKAGLLPDNITNGSWHG